MKLEVHPVTAIFPTMTDKELEGLAEDIKEHGLRDPIVMQDGRLIDGQNRLRACELAGVEPEFMQLAEEEDPISYILSANVLRRFMTKGQRAMALAMVYPEPEKGGRGKEGKLAKSLGEFSGESVRQARAVLAHSPDLARAVVAGAERLSLAYEEVRPDRGESVTEVAREAPAQPARSRKADLPSYKPEPQATQAELAKHDNMLDLDKVEAVFRAYERLTPSEKRAFRHRLDHPDEIAF